MPFDVLLGAFVFIGTVFAVLAVWQRGLARLERQKALGEIRDAESRGTRSAIAQHPQIDPLRCLGCGSCVTACPEEGVLGLVDGIAHVIHGSRCIGHGRCAEVCPVGALTVGLGDVASRSDIPVLSGELETTVPGVYIAGELGGIALIRHAVDQGTRAVAAIARSVGERPAPKSSGVLDVLVVGAGPAGLAASLKAKETGLSSVTIDQDDLGGTVRKYPRRKLTMTQPFELPLHGKIRRHESQKEELIELFEGIVRKFELDVRSRTRLLGVRQDDTCFVAETSGGEIRTRSVVLALGRRGTPRKLGAPGEDEEKVLYQLVDAASYTDQNVLVVGGGDSAIEAAAALAGQPGNTVTLSYRKAGFFRLKPRNERRIEELSRAKKIRLLFSSQVEAIEPDSVTLSVASGDGEGAPPRRGKIPNDFVFVFAGGEPPFPLLRSMGIGFGGDAEGDKAQRSEKNQSHSRAEEVHA